MAFEIIKNAEIPVNPRGRSGDRTPIYPFAKMEVGDGFDAPRDMGVTGQNRDTRQSRISSCCRLWAKRNNPSAKFTVRLLDENTVRCVRIA